MSDQDADAVQTWWFPVLPDDPGKRLVQGCRWRTGRRSRN